MFKYWQHISQQQAHQPNTSQCLLTACSFEATPPAAGLAAPKGAGQLCSSVSITSTLTGGDDAARPRSPEPLLTVVAHSTDLCGFADVQRGEEIHVALLFSILPL